MENKPTEKITPFQYLVALALLLICICGALVTALGFCRTIQILFPLYIC